MSLLPLLGALGVGLGLLGLAVGVLRPGSSAHLPASARTRRRLMISAVGGLPGSSGESNPPPANELPPALQRLTERSRRLVSTERAAALERRVALAGVEARWPADRVLAAKVGLGTLGVLLGLIVFVASPGIVSIVMGALLAAMGYLGPDVLLQMKATERQTEIRRDLADTLDQITITVEAGLGFEAAVERVTRGQAGTLKMELARMLRDVQMGLSREQAFDALLARTDVRDLRTFVRAVAQAERYGIAISQILKVQAAELRDKRRQRAEEQAAKVAVKMTIPTIFCILPALFIVVLAPTLINGLLGS